MHPIREAGPHDLALLLRFGGEFYAEQGYDFDERLAASALEALLADPTLGRAWIVEVEGEAVGYLVVGFGFSVEYGGRDAILDEFYLRPERRGAGLGNRALEATEAACRALGIRALHLEVERDNDRGQALYRRRGFGGNDRMLLTKRLAPDSDARREESSG